MLVGMGQRVVRDQRSDMREFGGFGLEKFLARGRVEKKIADGDRGSGGRPDSSTLKILPPLISTTVPEGSPGSRVSRRRRQMEAIEGSASPRKPSVAMLSRSSAFLSLEVAWRSKASKASSRTMPQPLSVIWISFLAAGFDLDFDAGGTGVERVLQKFFDDRSRPLHHLASSDLVGDLFGEDVNAAHGGSVWQIEAGKAKAGSKPPTSKKAKPLALRRRACGGRAPGLSLSS